MREVTVCPICLSTKFNEVLHCQDFTVSHETFHVKECNTCHLLITSPSPEISQLNKYYNSDQYISHTSKATSLINTAYLLVRTRTIRSKLKLVNKYVNPTNPKTILDYGCGTGEFLRACKTDAWDINGLEPSANARNLAQTNCQQSIASTIQELPANKQFQVITLWHVLEHIPDINETLTALRNKLDDNGRLIVALPNHNSWDAQHYKEYWAGYDVPRHLWHFSQTNIRTLLLRHGLTPETQVPMHFDAFYVSLLSEQYKQKNKTTVSGLANATLNGFRSNHHAKSNTEYSSLIYIAKK